jgi:hypothetical protein
MASIGGGVKEEACIVYIVKNDEPTAILFILKPALEKLQIICICVLPSGKVQPVGNFTDTLIKA